RPRHGRAGVKDGRRQAARQHGNRKLPRRGPGMTVARARSATLRRNAAGRCAMTIGLVVLCALGALGAFVLAPAAALAQTDKDAAAEKSRSVRITTRAPEPDKWLSARSPDGLRRV